MANYTTEADALAAAGVPGWTVTGREREYENVTTRDENNQSVTTKQPTGNTIVTVQSPDGKKHDTITLGQAVAPEAKGGMAITVVKGAAKDQSGNAPSTPSGWTPVYSTPGDASTTVIGQWDPTNNEFHPQAASAGAKPSGTYTNVVDPNDPQKKRVIGMVDTGDGSWHAVSNDPNLPGRQIVNTPTAVYAVDAENKVTKLFDIDKTSPFQAVIVDGKPFRFDPNTGTFTAGPVNEHPDIKDQNGLVMTWSGSDEEGKYAYPPGVEPPKTLTGVGTTSPNLIWYNATTGQEISRQQNPNYRPPQAQLPAQNANAPMVPIEDPDKPGQIKWVPNQGQVMAGDALSELAAQLTKTVVDPNHPLTLDQAKTLIDSASSRMQTEASQAQTAAGAAQNILTSQQQGAQTGAGMLQQRQQATQGLIQQGLGMVGQGASRSGNYGGGMLTAPAGFGANLVQGAQGFATELGGGQAVYDTAARMVQAADPNNQNPDRAQAIGVLAHIMNHYQQSTGQEFPTVTATKALQQGQQAGGMAAPGVSPLLAPQPTSSPAYAAGGAGPVMAGQFTAPPSLAAGQPAAVFTAPSLAVNNLTNLDPRLRGAIY